jgi:hypothetical protein
MYVWNDLRGARAIVLHNVVVGYAGDGGDGAGEEGEPEACLVLVEGNGEWEMWDVVMWDVVFGVGVFWAEDLPISLLSTASMSATLTLCCLVVTSKCPIHKFT